MLCSYGCGEKGKYVLKNGKLCCKEFYTKCKNVRKKNSLSRLGIKNKNFLHKEHIKKFHCKYCNELQSSSGIKSHEKFCYLNPKNKKNCPVCGEPIKKFNWNKTCSRKCGAVLGMSTVSDGKTRINYRLICFHHHGHKCLICDEDLFLIAHHVDGDRTNNIPENLLPLCYNHHLYIHHQTYFYILKECIEEYLQKFKRRVNV